MKKFALIFAVVLAGQVHAQSVNEKKQDLEKTKKKIQSQKQQLKTLEGKEDSILKKINQIDQKKAQLQGQKGGLQKNIKTLDGEIQKTSTSIDQRKQNIAQRQGTISTQLRDLYMHGEMNYMKMFLASASFEDLGQKQFLVRQWVDHDRKKIANFQDEARNLSIEKNQLEEKKSVKKRDLSELQKTENDILQEKTSKKKLLTMVKTQKEYYKKSIEELEQASKNLEALIKQFKSKPASKSTTSGGGGSSRFSQMKGRLLMPVRGNIEKKYGPYVDQKLHVNLYHKGVDIRAAEGTSVSSVFDGKVVYADWFSGYGKVVILDHDGGYFSLYAHLSETSVSINQQVTVGDEIGKVGDTESLKGDYLYFELREKGVTVNPLPWFDR
jgi:septal ring factor EnvC (AmiA/AmiB activator)